MAKKENNQKMVRSIALVILLLAVLIAALYRASRLFGEDQQTATSFGECRDMGGTIAESYPEQCFIGDQSFVNPGLLEGLHVDQVDTSECIGLSEADAYSKADSNGQAARVVSIDGESQTVIMNYIPGRLNLHMVDGLVDRVEVEQLLALQCITTANVSTDYVSAFYLMHRQRPQGSVCAMCLTNILSYANV